LIADVTQRRGTVRELHDFDPLAAVGDAAEVWWLQPEDLAVALGSRQGPEILDTDECARLGIGVVKRRSGGGAVLLIPDQVVWVDIVVPAGGAPDDVRASMVWAGEAWRRALAPFAAGGELTVHTGSMVATPWSDLVCFAGLGPGEVSLDGRKLVGLSQRRTRNGMRVQGTLYTAPPAIDLASLFRAPRPAIALPTVASLAVDPAQLAAD